MWILLKNVINNQRKRIPRAGTFLSEISSFIIQFLFPCLYLSFYCILNLHLLFYILFLSLQFFFSFSLHCLILFIYLITLHFPKFAFLLPHIGCEISKPSICIKLNFTGEPKNNFISLTACRFNNISRNFLRVIAKFEVHNRLYKKVDFMRLSQKMYIEEQLLIKILFS